MVADLRERSGLDVVGASAFGDTPELQDKLLDLVRRGTKRATAGSLEELAAADEPFPEPGLHWGLLDGRGRAHFVMQTVHVTRGRLAEVTPAFAWDEGEHDRTLESWLEAHRRYFTRQGSRAPDELEVVFERFRVVWPEADQTVWLAPDVRELCWDERDWVEKVCTEHRGTTHAPGRDRSYDVTILPGLVCEREGQRVGLLTFRPHPDGQTECVAVEALVQGAGVKEALTTGLAELGRRNDWRDV